MFSDYCYLSQRAVNDLLRFVFGLQAAENCKVSLQHLHKMLTLLADKMQLLHHCKSTASTYNTINNKYLQMLNQSINKV
jgi:hypothetical protein